MRDLRWVSIAALLLCGASAARAEEAGAQNAEQPAPNVVSAPFAAQRATIPGSGFSFGFKLGNDFISGLSTHSLRTGLELGHRLDPDWMGFVQVQFNWTPKRDGIDQSFGVVPRQLGIRHLYDLEQHFQPYWGFGLDLQLALNGKFGFVKETGPLPTLLGLAGFQYMFTDRFGLGLDSSTNLAQAMLGLVGETASGVVTFDVNATINVRF